MKIVIVGGVAGGASAAARLRRNDEQAEIVLLERGEFISFANCGLPYYIGGVIPKRESLTLQTPESFHQRFRVDVRTQNEVIAINRQNKTVRVRNRKDNSEYEESYDKLILSPGAAPIRPRLPGFDHPKVFTLRTIPDTLAIKDFCDKQNPRHAVVIGGGYIGVEVAENLRTLGIAVTLVELSPHVIPPIDADMTAQIQNHMRAKGVALRLGTGVSSIEEQGNQLVFSLSDSQTLTADFAVLAAGVSPESALAKDAELATGLRGAIAVNNYMRTSDENIYAVGDAVEVTEIVGGNPAFIPLASPANKQGRLVADTLSGRPSAYNGSQGSSVLQVFDLTVAATGLSEAALQAQGIAYHKYHLFPASHASYYPGALPMRLKILFAPDSGKVLGAQAVGFDGVEKRIDVIATVLRMGGTVYDLTELELCYAPPFSSAKDPVNMAGYVAQNILENRFVPFYPEDFPLDKDVLLVDVRTAAEFANGTILGAVNLPLDSLRENLHQLPKDREIYIFCQVGLRGYLASRILLQMGYSSVKNLSGGYLLWRELEMDRKASSPNAPAPTSAKPQPPKKPQSEPVTKEITVDACGLSCPGPLITVKKALEEAAVGDVLSIRATDPAFLPDMQAFCRRTGHSLLESGFDGKAFLLTLKKNPPMQEEAQSKSTAKSMVVFSGDLDKAIAAFILANGAAAMGREVHMFFTFWGLNILRRPTPIKTQKNLIEKMFGAMMPRGSRRLGLSNMNMGGMGAKMIRSVMKNKNIDSLESLIDTAIQAGVHITACSMSMDVMGIKQEELIDGVKLGGVAAFWGNAEESDSALFI